MNELILLAVGFAIGALIVFFIINGKRHKDRLENQKVIDDLKASFELKLNSEIEQAKRRFAKVSEQDANKKLEDLASDLLPVIDAMHMAIGLQTDNIRSVKDGVHMIYDRLEGALKQHGCTTIHPQPGEPFNPEIHQAVASYGAPNDVLEVKRVGFKVGEKVLRPAAVEVGEHQGKVFSQQESAQVDQPAYEHAPRP